MTGSPEKRTSAMLDLCTKILSFLKLPRVVVVCPTKSLPVPLALAIVRELSLRS